MKKIFQAILACGLIFGLASTVNAQCTNTSSYGSASINPSGAITTITTLQWASEYNTISNAVAGQTLKFTSSVGSDYITVRSGSASGPVLAHGPSPLTFNNTYSGTIYSHWNLNASCSTSTSGFRTTTVQCASCVAPPAPSNDLCGSPTTISCGQTLTGSTAQATPDAAPTCGGFSVGTGGGVWYKFVGTGSFVTASLCGGGTTYDSKLHVYSGSCTNLICVDGDDDGCDAPTTLASTVTWCSTQGQVYYILVNGFGTATGPFSLTMNCNAGASVAINTVTNSCVSNGPVTLSANFPGGTFSGPGVSGNTFSPSVAGVGTHTITYTVCSATATTTTSVGAAPSNDVCANAIAVSCGASYSGSTRCATPDAGLTFCGTTGGTANGVWYSFQGNDAFVTMNTCAAGSNYDTKLHVFEGSCGSLNCVTGNDDYFSTPYSCSVSGLRSIVEFCAEAGKTYYVLVSGFGTNSGEFVLNVDCGTPLSVEAGACQTRFVGYTGAGAPSDIIYICPSAAGGDGNYSTSISPAADFACDNGCYGVSPSATTTYTVSVTDGNGCTVTDQIEVQVIDVVAACPTNGQPKVQICHVPPGNPNNANNICISPNAVPAHLAGGNGHGTCYLGPCGNTCRSTNPACAPSVCAGGTFTITISGTGFLDETSWTFAGASGGNYGLGSTNSITVPVPAGTPSEFCIETQGSFNDNDANYSITCDGGVIASGTVLGGGSVCVQDICCNGIAPSNKGAEAQGTSANRGGVIAFPNPFTEFTTFRFRTATAGQASLVVFALDGKQVASVFEGVMDAQEVKEVEFAAQGLSAGTYLYRFISPEGKMSMGKVAITK